LFARLRRQWILPPDRFSLRYAPAIGWALLIFIMSSIPGDKYPEVNVRFADKWVHLLLYSPIGWLFVRAAAGEKRPTHFSPVPILAFISGALWGASDEIHQIWVRNRSCDVRDWMVDIVGIALGVAVWLLMARDANRPEISQMRIDSVRE
jgi:VanZ family protein